MIKNWLVDSLETVIAGGKLSWIGECFHADFRAISRKFDNW